jgi:hypothetical protein
VFDNVAGSFITDPGKAAETLSVSDLSKVATPESIVKYVKSQDPKDLLALEEETNQASRDSVIGSAASTLNTVREAKETLKKSYLGLDPGGISGALTSLIPGTPAHQLMTSTYVTIAGREALDEINRMKEEAAKFGSTGTGLGQITQIEFSALQGNLAKLNTGLTVQAQLELLDKIDKKLNSVMRIAGGEKPIDVIDFSEDVYVEAGYIRGGGEVYYFSSDGKEFVYDRNKEKFVPAKEGE